VNGRRGDRRLACCLLFEAFLVAAAPGCQALYRYRPVPVLVRDAETKQPIVGAEVRVSYPLTRPSQAPWDSVALTGDDGVARLRAAPYGSAGVRVEAAAKGYLSEDLSVPVETVQEMEPPRPFEDTTQRPARFVLEMYTEPGPRVELILPNGFRGLIRAEVRIQEDAPLSPGQRIFRFPVEPPGVVQVSGPPLLRRIYAPDYAARYADGTLIRRPAGDWDVGLRPLNGLGLLSPPDLLLPFRDVALRPAGRGVNHVVQRRRPQVKVQASPGQAPPRQGGGNRWPQAYRCGSFGRGSAGGRKPVITSAPARK
jgi:hypothetical protein